MCPNNGTKLISQKANRCAQAQLELAPVQSWAGIRLNLFLVQEPMLDAVSTAIHCTVQQVQRSSRGVRMLVQTADDAQIFVHNVWM